MTVNARSVRNKYSYFTLLYQGLRHGTALLGLLIGAPAWRAAPWQLLCSRWPGNPSARVGNSYWSMCWYITRISCRNFGTTWFWFWFYLTKWTFPTCVTVAPLALSFLSNILTNSLLVACVDICNGVFLFLFFPVRKKIFKETYKIKTILK